MNVPTVDPVTMEVLRGRFTAVADEMQHALIKSSYSTIVTEALDATCAVYDRDGRTVAQACAIPIHLGAYELGRRFAALSARARHTGDVYGSTIPCGAPICRNFAVRARSSRRELWATCHHDDHQESAATAGQRCRTSRSPAKGCAFRCFVSRRREWSART